MLLTRTLRATVFVLIYLSLMSFYSAQSRAQAALLLEEPYGFFGSVFPSGHNAIYFARICAETSVKLRRCQAGELGSVISRYPGIAGYDWVAVPLLPYLYSVENASDLPARVNRETVKLLRSRYREAHLLSLGEHLSPGNVVHGGWTQLMGVSFERRIYAFRIETSKEQDDELIARLNESENRSHFSLLFNNCSDFARIILNIYFPGTFRRGDLLDAWMTSPKQVAYKLERYSRKHPELQLTIFEIPQIPGYRRHSHRNKNFAESLATTGYVIPIALLNPYLAGGLFVDYLVRGRHQLIPKNPVVLTPGNLFALTVPARPAENPHSADVQALSAVVGGSAEVDGTETANFGLKEIGVAHE